MVEQSNDSTPEKGEPCGAARSSLDTFWAGLASQVWSSEPKEELQRRDAECTKLKNDSEPLAGNLNQNEKKQLAEIQQALVEGDAKALQSVVASMNVDKTPDSPVIHILNEQLTQQHKKLKLDISPSSDFSPSAEIGGLNRTELVFHVPIRFAYSSTVDELTVRASANTIDSYIRKTANSTGNGLFNTQAYGSNYNYYSSGRGYQPNQNQYASRSQYSPYDNEVYSSPYQNVKAPHALMEVADQMNGMPPAVLPPEIPWAYLLERSRLH